MEVFYDRSQTIRAAVDDVQMTLLIAGRAGGGGDLRVPAPGHAPPSSPRWRLPIAVIGTFAGMAMLGFNLDNLSLMALTLSVGFVVDDAIVMLENIVRHIEAGEKPYEAALKGSREIGFTILSMTVSLAAVFIPIVFMSGIVGRLLHEFSLTIIVAILISGLVSVTLTPMLCARVLKDEHGQEHNASIAGAKTASTASRPPMTAACAGAWPTAAPSWASSSPASPPAIGLFEFMPQDFLPSDDTGQLRGSIQTATGTSFDQSHGYVRQVSTSSKKTPMSPGIPVR